MAKFRIPLLKSLPAFEAAARHQSIKKASDELHVTHAAVSRHIQKLELRLGRRLFKRSHRRVELTDDGDVLFNAVSTGLSQIQRAFTHLTGRQRADRLVISADPDFAGLWLVPRLAEFHAIVSDTLVEIVSARGSPAAQESRISCTIHYAAVSAGSGGDLLFRSRLFPVCTRELAQSLPPESLEALSQHTLLHDRSTGEWQDYLRQCASAAHVNLGRGLIFSETALCLDAAARGQGIALGDDYLAATFLAEGRLVRPFSDTLLSRNAYYLVIADNASKHPSVKAFRAWLLRSIEGQRADSR